MINKNESKTVMGPMDILINHFCFCFFLLLAQTILFLFY